MAPNEGITSKCTIIVVTMVVDHQMPIIVVHVKKMVDDVFLNVGSRVNAITYGLKKNLGLPPPQLTPFNL